MFKIGDLIVYSGHGICQVDDICDRTFAGVTKNYYILHPIDNNENITISAPVENSQSSILKIMNREEALDILESFQQEGADWIERPQLRNQVYTKVVQTGEREKIADVASTLLRKKHELESEDKKLYEQDTRLLTMIENVLFKELAISLETTYEDVFGQIMDKLELVENSPQP